MDPSYLGRPIQAPTAQKPTGLMTKRTLLLLLGGGLAVVAGVFILIASQDNSGQLQQQLSARQATTLKLITDGQKNITGDDLSKLNSELSVVLLSDNTNLQTTLKLAGLKKVDKEVTAAEADAETFAKLKSAKLNGQYDRTYTGVITQKIESLRGLIQELHDATKKKPLKAILATEYKHLSAYLDQLETLRKD